MENEKKEETGKLDRAKALASAIKGGDEQLAQDCLDFADFPPEVRKEALERCKAGKCDKKDGEKDATDKAPKAAKDDADVPTPPDLPKPEEKPAESPAPESSAASAPAPTPAPEATSAPAPEDVKSPKGGESPVEAKDAKDKAPTSVPVCDKCGCSPCECKKDADTKEAEDKATKDCGTPVTEPSAPTPVSALQAPTEEKKEEVPPAKDAKDKAPADVKVEGAEVVAEKPDGEIKGAEVVETKAEDKADKRIEADVKAEHQNLPPGKAKVAQDEYAAFIAEYTEAQTLAQKLRPHIKETFDSAPMRVIDVARFAAKHIDNLAFVMDEADDEKVLTAVRGYAAAVAMDSAPKTEVFEDKLPTAEVIAQDEAPVQTKKATSKDLLAYMTTES